jgi:hypothetical protein
MTTTNNTASSSLQLSITSADGAAVASVAVPAGQVTKLAAKAGQRYAAKRLRAAAQAAAQGATLAPAEAAAATPEAVVATREDQDLRLHYAGDTQLLITDFYAVCGQGACAALLPGQAEGGLWFEPASGGTSTSGLVYGWGEAGALQQRRPGGVGERLRVGGRRAALPGG